VRNDGLGGHGRTRDAASVRGSNRWVAWQERDPGAHDRFRHTRPSFSHDRYGDDAIVSAALPPASAAAREETRVGGHGLLLYA
jgi:hypothetical protein